jgi:hypothetical protein
MGENSPYLVTLKIILVKNQRLHDFKNRAAERTWDLTGFGLFSCQSSTLPRRLPKLTIFSVSPKQGCQMACFQTKKS